MTRLLLAGGAGTAAARANADLVEVEQQRVAVQAAHRKAGMTGQTFGWMAGKGSFRNQCQNTLNQVIAQRNQASNGCFAFGFGQSERLGDASDQRNGLRSAATMRLLTAAQNLRLQSNRA